LMRQIMLSV
jgi:hypothetical protein